MQTVSSSWAIATSPQPQNIWKDAALIWENSKDYLYARTTRAGRIIIGGEDSDEIIEPEARDRLIPEKSRLLAQRLAALWPVAKTDIEFRWAGTFDTTRDGLPLIGPVPGAKGVYAAYGYGGNGITFSFLAAHLIGDLIAGSTSPLLRDFALDRDGGSIGQLTGCMLGTLAIVARYLMQSSNIWRLTWVSVEVHCSGCSEFRFRSFFFSRCSGITSCDFEALKPGVPDGTFWLLRFRKAANRRCVQGSASCAGPFCVEGTKHRNARSESQATEEERIR